MRNFAAFLIALVLAGTAEARPHSSYTGVSASGHVTLHVRAFIDGHSLLEIQGTAVHWHHLASAAPGLWGGHHDPTRLNDDAWFPKWPHNRGKDLRDCNCDSSSHQLSVGLAAQTQTVLLNPVHARQPVRITQQPDDSNGDTLIVDFNDGAPGAAWYDVTLTYVPGASTPGAFTSSRSHRDAKSHSREPETDDASLSPADCRKACDEKRAATVANCEDPKCEQRADDLLQICRSDCTLSPEERAARAHHQAHLLAVQHHPQATPVWCWAASVAMVAEFLTQQPVNDCEVASRLDRLNGGEGYCCDHEGNLRKEACFHGGEIPDITRVLQSYGTRPSQINRALTWDEVRQSIDAGHPIMIALNLMWSGHAEVIVGYRAPGTLLILDPWQERMQRPNEVSYLGLAGDGTMADSWRAWHAWKLSWVFSEDDNASAAHMTIDSPAPVDSGPARSTVSIEYPLLEGQQKTLVEKRTADHFSGLRACYDQAINHGKQLVSPSTVRLTFAVEKTTPTFVMVKDAGGLPSEVSQCVANTVAAWEGLFPRDGIDESQKMEITFTRLDKP